uniref:Uncharacterized protein LOC111107308 isoform X2 n=1 Tax=Crassostrea virginica TaxID=6565 RepID=A0A8B8B625_CRAVI|nr:uncharacterized protein LOC111107308 isoform X2 [Crassostrea virginica]
MQAKGTSTYRQLMRTENKAKYEIYLQEQKQRMKEYRSRIKQDPKKLQEQREKAKVRQKKYRDKKKEEGKESRTKSKEVHASAPNTRTRVEEKRQKWRESKRKYRKKLSMSQKVWIKRKDRDRKRRIKEEMCNNNLSSTSDILSSQKIFQNKQSLYNMTYKARKVLPKSPKKFASIIQKLVQNSTPKKRKAVDQLLGSSAAKKLKEENEECQLSKNKNEGHTIPVSETTCMIECEKVSNNKDIDYEVLAEEFSNCPNNNIKVGKKTLKEKLRTSVVSCKKKCPPMSVVSKYRLPMATINKVKHFYLREDISTPLPQRRYATKHGPCHIMQMTLRGAFALFARENSKTCIGFTKFTTLRPKNVRLLKMTNWNFCVCTICQNMSYKLKALNKISDKSIPNIEELLNIILCPKSDGQRFHAPDCIFRKCEKCKDVNIEEKLSAYLNYEKHDGNSSIVWNHWEKTQRNKTNETIVKVLKTKRADVKTLLEEVSKDFKEPIQSCSFPEHNFVGKWQQRQFLELKQNLPDDAILLVMDFGKNRTVRYQDEPKSIYYTANQITIHPVVIYFHSKEISNLIVRKSVVFLSDDINHDHNAVDHFFELAVSHISDLKIKFTKLIVFSDGCASQYKGKGSFADLSLKKCRIERNYFGSDHGKSECDGEVGSLNRSVDMAIVGRKAIVSDAKDLYSWCMENLCLDEPGSKRTFIHVKKGEIDRARNSTNVKTLQGSRKLHQFFNIPSCPYKLLVKKLSCYCLRCRDGETD